MTLPRHLLCLSQLRWDFVFQRPHHLMTRAARTFRVTWWEEPVWIPEGTPHLVVRTVPGGIVVAQPHLPWGADHDTELRALLDAYLDSSGIVRPMLWFITPAALAYAGHIEGGPVVYDCMDELSSFAGADPTLPERERELIARAEIVFTGGRSLFEAKRRLSPSVHLFPSGVDAGHFRAARGALPEPASARGLKRPRAGFYGVLDERLDTALLAGVAALLPDVALVLLGPKAKIDDDELPRAPNLHYPGPAPYAELPAHLAHWDAALLPFRLNEATRHISPTKTPEYLAAGRPVISTPIPDVVAAWSSCPAVQIAADAPEFAAAIRRAIAQGLPRTEADPILHSMSWDGIWSRMLALVRAPVAA